MQTLEQQEKPDDRIRSAPKISYPEEIIEEIFSRLPVKSILRFRSLSKSWLSIISGPLFTKLQINRATRTALFISARDKDNGYRHLFSGSLDSGSVTHCYGLIPLQGMGLLLNTTQNTSLVGERAHLVYKPHISCPYNRCGTSPIPCNGISP
ncbi:putative F-box domain-containing protein [Helianthus debilis subsp. tardiflorus]